jgi:cell division protein FtsB
LVLYALLLGEGGWLRVARLQAEVDQLEADLASVRRAQEERRMELEELSRPGSLVLEAVARERYGLLRPGEKVLHVLGGQGESLAPEAPVLSPRAESSPNP